MRAALARIQIVGVRTNVEFLGRLMSAPSFVEAALDTALIERERAHSVRAARRDLPRNVGAGCAGNLVGAAPEGVSRAGAVTVGWPAAPGRSASAGSAA